MRGSKFYVGYVDQNIFTLLTRVKLFCMGQFWFTRVKFFCQSQKFLQGCKFLRGSIFWWWKRGLEGSSKRYLDLHFHFQFYVNSGVNISHTFVIYIMFEQKTPPPSVPKENSKFEILLVKILSLKQKPIKLQLLQKKSMFVSTRNSIIFLKTKISSFMSTLK